MTGTVVGRVAVVVAATDAQAVAREGLARFVAEVGDRGEVVLVSSSDRGGTEVALPGLRHLRRPAGRLAPELWADGLDATDAPLVALSTASMIPRPGWLATLVNRLQATGAAAVGGPIVPAVGLSAFDRAIDLHRYARYRDLTADRIDREPPGDNVLYRRDRLEALGRPWGRGFWEVDIHRRLRARGERLVLDPEGIVTFAGGCRPLPTLRQRFAHARRFAANRARGRGWVHRLARTVAAPAVPAVLMARIIRSPRGRWAMPTLREGSALAVVLATWALGEAAGLWLGPGVRPDDQREAGSIPAPLAGPARGA